ncbi:anti-sigma F factor [Pseudoflavonifractor capillosus]|nr:anti-sigma F factor [Pseudoflavonifractor capillosus]MBM6897664.1 anti-sigma F factor [Pseudoflavonifractor capillosus]
MPPELAGSSLWNKEEYIVKALDQTTVVFTSRSANEGFARAVAACFATRLDPTLDEVADIKTAVSEAVTNAIVHAYPDSIGKITMRLRLLEDHQMEIQIKDSGVGIPDVEQARTPLFTTGNEERSGMGFTIMESFMDSVKVRSAVGKGTTVTMRRRIALRVGGGQ